MVPLLLVRALRPLVAFLEANRAIGSCLLPLAPASPLQRTLVPLLLRGTLGFLDSSWHLEVWAANAG